MNLTTVLFQAIPPLCLHLTLLKDFQTNHLDRKTYFGLILKMIQKYISKHIFLREQE